MLDFWNDNQSLLIYLAIPITSALVGWLTNVVAIKMTFYPLNFIGIKPIGWQGIIPSKAAKMSSISVDLWTSKLINVKKELFAKINPDKVAKEMRPEFDRIAKEIMDEIMEEQAPEVWSRVPESVKKITYARISKDMPEIVTEMMTDIKENIDEMFDIKIWSLNV